MLARNRENRQAASYATKCDVVSMRIGSHWEAVISDDGKVGDGRHDFFLHCESRVPEETFPAMKSNRQSAQDLFDCSG